MTFAPVGLPRATFGGLKRRSGSIVIWLASKFAKQESDLEISRDWPRRYFAPPIPPLGLLLAAAILPPPWHVRQNA
jgi:hypothetical protein